MKSSQVTIIDIAKALGISKSTVSRALTNHPKVKEETRRQIIELAEKLEYQPNMLSVGLRTNRTKTIGVVVPEFSSSFFPQAVVGIQEEASKHRYSVLISQCDEDYETEVANSKVMLVNHVDGVIVSLTKETQNFDHWRTFVRRNIPIVFFDRVCNEIMVPKVVVNDYDAAFKAVEHLISLGRTRIAHLAGPRNLIVSKKRLNGYLDGLIKHKLPVDESLIIDSDAPQGELKMCIRNLLSLNKPIDAIFAFNDPVALNAMQVVKKTGRRIPQDVAVVGFGDDYGSNFSEPSLTTVCQPVREIGRAAMSLLLDLIGNEAVDWKPIVRVMEAELVVRQSTVKPRRSDFPLAELGDFQRNGMDLVELSPQKVSLR